MTSPLEHALPQSNTRFAAKLLAVMGPLIGMVLVFALFSFLVKDGRFYTSNNILTMIRQTTIVWIAALGMTLVIIAAGIDLSAGSIVSVTTVIIALVLRAHAYKNDDDDLVFMGGTSAYLPLLAVLAGVGVAALAGLHNGLLITGLRVVPFIITLGAMQAFRGFSEKFAHQTNVNAPDTWINGMSKSLPHDQKWMIFPTSVWLAIALSIVVVGLLHYTRFGRHVFAIGSNEQTARLCGVPVARTKILVYMLMGIFAGIAGVIQYSRIGQGDPTIADGLELRVIAAVVIGGGSLAGGAGSVLGTIAGALTMTFIDTGVDMAGYDNSDKKIVIGYIIVAAVALDRLRSRRST